MVHRINFCSEKEEKSKRETLKYCPWRIVRIHLLKRPNVTGTRNDLVTIIVRNPDNEAEQKKKYTFVYIPKKKKLLAAKATPHCEIPALIHNIHHASYKADSDLRFWLL